MQFNPGFNTYSLPNYGQNFFTPTVPISNGSINTEIIGEGEVTTVILPDGTTQLYFHPTARWCSSPICTTNFGVNNHGLWFIRSVSNPIPHPCYNQQSVPLYNQQPNFNSLFNQQNNTLPCVNPFVKQTQSCKSNIAIVSPEYKFHNDDWTSTTDLSHFCPQMYSPYIVHKTSVSTQASTPCEKSTLCIYEVNNKPYNCPIHCYGPTEIQRHVNKETQEASTSGNKTCKCCLNLKRTANNMGSNIELKRKKLKDNKKKKAMYLDDDASSSSISLCVTSDKEPNLIRKYIHDCRQSKNCNKLNEDDGNEIKGGNTSTENISCKNSKSSSCCALVSKSQYETSSSSKQKLKDDKKQKAKEKRKNEEKRNKTHDKKQMDDEENLQKDSKTIRSCSCNSQSSKMNANYKHSNTSSELSRTYSQETNIIKSNSNTQDCDSQCCLSVQNLPLQKLNSNRDCQYYCDDDDITSDKFHENTKELLQKSSSIENVCSNYYMIRPNKRICLRDIRISCDNKNDEMSNLQKKYSEIICAENLTGKEASARINKKLSGLNVCCKYLTEVNKQHNILHNNNDITKQKTYTCCRSKCQEYDQNHFVKNNGHVGAECAKGRKKDCNANESPVRNKSVDYNSNCWKDTCSTNTDSIRIYPQPDICKRRLKRKHNIIESSKNEKKMKCDNYTNTTAKKEKCGCISIEDLLVKYYSNSSCSPGQKYLRDTCTSTKKQNKCPYCYEKKLIPDEKKPRHNAYSDNKCKSNCQVCEAANGRKTDHCCRVKQRERNDIKESIDDISKISFKRERDTWLEQEAMRLERAVKRLEKEEKKLRHISAMSTKPALCCNTYDNLSTNSDDKDRNSKRNKHRKLENSNKRSGKVSDRKNKQLMEERKGKNKLCSSSHGSDTSCCESYESLRSREKQSKDGKPRALSTNTKEKPKKHHENKKHQKDKKRQRGSSTSINSECASYCKSQGTLESDSDKDLKTKRIKDKPTDKRKKSESRMLKNDGTKRRYNTEKREKEEKKLNKNTSGSSIKSYESPESEEKYQKKARRKEKQLKDEEKKLRKEKKKKELENKRQKEEKKNLERENSSSKKSTSADSLSSEKSSKKDLKVKDNKNKQIENFNKKELKRLKDEEKRIKTEEKKVRREQYRIEQEIKKQNNRNKELGKNRSSARSKSSTSFESSMSEQDSKAKNTNEKKKFKDEEKNKQKENKTLEKVNKKSQKGDKNRRKKDSEQNSECQSCCSSRESVSPTDKKSKIKTKTNHDKEKGNKYKEDKDKEMIQLKEKTKKEKENKIQEKGEKKYQRKASTKKTDNDSLDEDTHIEDIELCPKKECEMISVCDPCRYCENILSNDSYTDTNSDTKSEKDDLKSDNSCENLTGEERDTKKYLKGRQRSMDVEREKNLREELNRLKEEEDRLKMERKKHEQQRRDNNNDEEEVSIGRCCCSILTTDSDNNCCTSKENLKQEDIVCKAKCSTVIPPQRTCCRMRSQQNKNADNNCNLINKPKNTEEQRYGPLCDCCRKKAGSKESCQCSSLYNIASAVSSLALSAIKCGSMNLSDPKTNNKDTGTHMAKCSGQTGPNCKICEE